MNYDNLTIKSITEMGYDEKNEPLYSLLKEYEDDFLGWLNKCNDNKRAYVDNPMKVFLSYVNDETFVAKLEEAINQCYLPEELNKMNQMIDNKKFPSLSSEPITPPTKDYCYKWDVVTSSKISTLNNVLEQMKNTEIPLGTFVDKTCTVKMKLGMFEIIGGNGSKLTLSFPIIEGKIVDINIHVLGEEKITKEEYSIDKCNLKMDIELSEILLNTKETDKRTEKTYEYRIIFSKSDNGIEPISNIKIEDTEESNLDEVPDKLKINVEGALQLSIGTFLDKVFHNTIPVYDITIADDASGVVHEMEEYLLPKCGRFQTAIVEEFNNSCMSVLMRTYSKDGGELKTEVDSIPQNCDIGLNISNKIFMGEIMREALAYGFRKIDENRNAKIGKESFYVKGDHNTILSSVESGFNVHIPIDNCPDVDIKKFSISINDKYQFVVNADFETSIAHIFDGTGRMEYILRLEVKDAEKDGHKYKTVAIVPEGEPIVDIDTSWGWVSIMIASIMGPVMAIIISIIKAIIDNCILDDIDFSQHINSNDLLNGKFSWKASDKIELVSAYPMGCLQLGFRTLISNE